MSHPDEGKGLRSESQQQFVKLTDAVERVELPAGKSQIYLYDTEQPGLALRVRASGGKSWVYLFTKPGVDGTQTPRVTPFGAGPCPFKCLLKRRSLKCPAARFGVVLKKGEACNGESSLRRWRPLQS